MRRQLVCVLAILLSPTFAGVFQHSAGAGEPTLVQKPQPVFEIRAIYQMALRGFERGDEGALELLQDACRGFDLAVSDNPTNVDLFIECSKAKRLLAEKDTPGTGPRFNLTLAWLSAQQERNGAWAFAVESDADKTDRSTIKATSVALLVFLGAGQSHRSSVNWESDIETGITFLMSEARVSDDGIDVRGPSGDTVAQAMATMMLCEAYDATADKRLEGPARQGVKFLESLQNQRSGGWSNARETAEDMVTTAWCVMALQSAAQAQLTVKPATKRLVESFLGNRQTEGGAFYGDIKAGKEPKATAAGLLCRCLLGWAREEPALLKGVEYLAMSETVSNDLEARFFATQVMFQVGGETWKAWRKATGEQLMATQIISGAKSGSWFFADDDSARYRGRLWHTALATLTREVYYQHLTVFKAMDGKGLAEIKPEDGKE